MNETVGLPTMAIVIVSVVNICLMATAAFRLEHTNRDGSIPMLRMRSGYLAVSLGLCSQILYCLMLAALHYSWIPLSQGYNSSNQMEESLAGIGVLLSTATLMTALLGRGFRRYAGILVGGTTWFLWGLAALGTGLGEAFEQLVRTIFGALLGGR